jgi:hypothetical protein
MDRLKEMLTMDPCYEQHIVSIKEIYEEYLFTILTPVIFDGFQSLYRKAHETEQKFITASKKNPDIENPGVLVIFQTLIKDIPNLNTHRIRNETDRIKASTKSADIFDDLIRAVAKANIILLTYNIDHKRKNLLKTKYHENIVIHDFIHSCYIQSARTFYNSPELFYHKLEPIVINQNKRTCYHMIKDAIRMAIRLMLPMKEILLEYITQKYEQKETPFNMMGMGMNGGMPNNVPNTINGVSREEFMDVNDMVNRDLEKFNDNQSLLEDEDEQNDFEESEAGNDKNKTNKEQDQGFSLLVSESQENENDKEEPTKGGAQENTLGTGIDLTKPIVENAVDPTNSVADGIKMIDIGGTMSKRGPASNYFNEMMPDIKKRMNEYKETKHKNTNSVQPIKQPVEQPADELAKEPVKEPVKELAKNLIPENAPIGKVEINRTKSTATEYLTSEPDNIGSDNKKNNIKTNSIDITNTKTKNRSDDRAISNMVDGVLR